MEIINDIEIDNLIFDMRDSFIDDFFEDYQIDFSQFDEDKKEKIKDGLKNNLNIDLDFNSFKNIQNIQLEDLVDEVKKLSNNNINLKKTKYTEEVFLMAQKSLLLQIIDKSWKEHLLSLDHLRQGISLRAYGQKDPLNEYKQEAFLMFEEMMRQIRETVSKIISFIEIKSEVPEPSSEIPEKNEKIPHGKIPRNAKCPCGSGKKYKHCCGKLN
jgi:preprotein translocase subunit SecA